MGEALYQEIDYLVQPENVDLVDSPGMPPTCSGVHAVAVGGHQQGQTQPAASPTQSAPPGQLPQASLQL